MFVPGQEQLDARELRVTILGSGNPWVTRAQASGSILVEVGNPERDLLVLDLGSGSLANFASLKLPVNALDKVFFTHLYADHVPDLIALFGSYRKSGRVDRGVRVGPEWRGAAPGHGAFRGRDPGGLQLGLRIDQVDPCRAELRALGERVRVL
jgi:hypothetical protein